MHSFTPLLSGAAFVALLAACTVQSGDGHHDHDQNQNQNSNDTPLTVVVDTNQTMNATGGQGLGVFVQYAANGHWHVWWTCDTALSGLPCDFTVQMTGTAIANATSSQFAATDTLTPPVAGSASSPLVATTHTTTGIAAVDFDATAGTNVTIDVSVSGLRDGNFFFFVQDGKIDGGYSGVLTDPLIFEPSSP